MCEIVEIYRSLFFLVLANTMTTVADPCAALVLELKLELRGVAITAANALARPALAIAATVDVIGIELRCGQVQSQALLRFAPARSGALHDVPVQPVAAAPCYHSKWHN